MVFIGNDWDDILDEEIKKDYFVNLLRKVSSEYKRVPCFPLKSHIFRALRMTPYNKVKVVIFKNGIKI